MPKDKAKRERTKLLAVVVEIEAPSGDKAKAFKDHMREAAEQFLLYTEHWARRMTDTEASKRSTVRTTVHSRAGLANLDR